ncbi:MAG: DinB family protein [Planctomycetes bacterium]|nr:DinB family protein [Planctomycetota bacterium]
MTRLELAIEQLQFARAYTLHLLEHTKDADWLQQPPGGVTHIAWQVGHLAIAEYWLTLVRTRGERPEDEELISKSFQKPFERQSTPEFDIAKYPSPDEIRAVLGRVHEQTLREVRCLDDSELDKPLLKPHPIAKTKLWGLLWCSHHETLHAGQIGLLRRQLGYAPLW